VRGRVRKSERESKEEREGGDRVRTDSSNERNADGKKEKR
jgi:hypothetical protein